MYHLARTDTTRGDLADDALEVADLLQRLADRLACLGLAEQVFHYRLTISYRSYFLERERHPAVQHTSAHRGDSAVDDVEQRTAVLALPARQFQIADREAVEPYVFVFFDTAQVLDMSRLEVLRHIKIHEDASCGRYTCRHLVQTETFEGTHAP